VERRAEASTGTAHPVVPRPRTYRRRRLKRRLQHTSRWSLRPSSDRSESRPEKNPTWYRAIGKLYAIVPPIGAVLAQLPRSTGRSSPAQDGGFADPEGRSVGGACKTPRRANRRRGPHQSPTLDERPPRGERRRVGSVTHRRRPRPALSRPVPSDVPLRGDGRRTLTTDGVGPTAPSGAGPRRSRIRPGG
jgi:hypothetical protein